MGYIENTEFSKFILSNACLAVAGKKLNCKLKEDISVKCIFNLKITDLISKVVIPFLVYTILFIGLLHVYLKNLGIDSTLIVSGVFCFNTKPVKIQQFNGVANLILSEPT